jgi:hypothetical protein
MIPLQTYYANIKIKTGKTPADFKKMAVAKGFFEKGKLKPTVKAGQVIAWLKKDFDLGHGHSLAIFHSFRDKEE